MNKRVVIIGGGIAGLAAALRLAGSYRVTLIEKNLLLGGKLGRWQAAHPRRPTEPPFRFDTGPSMLTMPYVLLDLFAAAGQDVREHLRILKLDPIARYCWPDGTRLDLRSGDEELPRELRCFSPHDRQGVARLLERGRHTWTLAEPLVTHAPAQLFDGPAGWLRWLSMPFRIGVLSDFARMIDRHVSSPKLRDLLYQYPLRVGAAPLHAPAALIAIFWLDHYFGSWHIEGGMYTLIERLERVARQIGVEIHTSVAVEQVVVEPSAPNSGGGRRPAAVGVKLSTGEQVAADAVVSSIGLACTRKSLLPQAHRRRGDEGTIDRSGSGGVLLMLGVEGDYPELAHQTKFMPEDYRAELHEVFETATVPHDPCIHVCSATRSDPTLAPSGCQTLLVLAAAPLRLESGDWSTEGPRYRDQLVGTLEHRWGLKDLGRRIVVERMIVPPNRAGEEEPATRSVERRANGLPRLTSNRDPRIGRLYYAGGSAHPGGGVPLAALSGKIASELVIEDLD